MGCVCVCITYTYAMRLAKDSAVLWLLGATDTEVNRALKSCNMPHRALSPPPCVIASCSL
jgi:hypothetical protein